MKPRGRLLTILLAPTIIIFTDRGSEAIDRCLGEISTLVSGF